MTKYLAFVLCVLTSGCTGSPPSSPQRSQNERADRQLRMLAYAKYLTPVTDAGGGRMTLFVAEDSDFIAALERALMISGVKKDVESRRDSRGDVVDADGSVGPILSVQLFGLGEDRASGQFSAYQGVENSSIYRIEFQKKKDRWEITEWKLIASRSDEGGTTDRSANSR